MIKNAKKKYTLKRFNFKKNVMRLIPILVIKSLLKKAKAEPIIIHIDPNSQTLKRNESMSDHLQKMQKYKKHLNRNK